MATKRCGPDDDDAVEQYVESRAGVGLAMVVGSRVEVEALRKAVRKTAEEVE